MDMYVFRGVMVFVFMGFEALVMFTYDMGGEVFGYFNFRWVRFGW
jgi:hypothetical protein